MLRLCCVVAILLAGNWAQAANLVVFGDSLSAGYGIDRQAAWPALLAEKLKQERYPYSVINASISGDTSAAGVARLRSVLNTHQPEIFIVELGANDGLRGLPVAEMKKNLSTIITSAQRTGAKVLLVGMRMPPNYGPDYTRQFENAFTELARTHKTALVPFLLDGVAADKALFQADGLHPVASAQPILLNTIWPKLRPLLKR